MGYLGIGRAAWAAQIGHLWSTPPAWVIPLSSGFLKGAHAHSPAGACRPGPGGRALGVLFHNPDPGQPAEGSEATRERPGPTSTRDVSRPVRVAGHSMAGWWDRRWLSPCNVASAEAPAWAPGSAQASWAEPWLSTTARLPLFRERARTPPTTSSQNDRGRGRGS